MKFSVIVPAYNAEQTIKKCINSVIKQTYKEWEVIVVNDGSSDNTLQILNEMSEDIIIVNTKNGGVSSARNKGLDVSTGEYVLFLDADDYLPIDTLEIYIKNIKESEEPDIIFGGFYKVYRQKQSVCFPAETDGVFDKTVERKDFSPYISRFAGTVWGKCYKRELIQNIRFDEELSLCEDAEFNYRVFQVAERMSYVKKTIYNYVYSADSTIRRYSHIYIENYKKSIVRIVEENKYQPYYNDVLEFSCNVFNVVCFNVILSNSNKKKLKIKKQEFLELRRNSIFCTIINAVQINQLSLKHRVAIICAKSELFICLYFISILYRFLSRLGY